MEKKCPAFFVTYAQKVVDDILAEFSTSLINGLTSDQVNKSLFRYGRNEKHKHPVYWWHVLRQIVTILPHA